MTIREFVKHNFLAISVGCLFCFGIFIGSAKSDFVTNSLSNKVAESKLNLIADNFDKTKYSTTEPSSLWVYVDKQRDIGDYKPELFVPKVPLRSERSNEQSQVAKVMLKDLVGLFNASKKANINLVLGSGYRSYQTQAIIYENSLKTEGQEETEHTSAQPGHSEHQTGLAIDFASPASYCFADDCWRETEEAKWLAENAYKHGFILRYPEGKEAITGYKFESWHYRYVGKELSNYLQQTEQTFDEFAKSI